jgi:hypothetical protein
LLVTCNHPFLQLLVLAGALRAQLSRFTRCYFYLPSKPCLRPFPLPGPPLLYFQPLSLLFPTLRSSALPGENTAVSERSYGPDCDTAGHCWSQAHSWAKPQPPHSQRAVSMCCGAPDSQTVYKIQINGRIFGSLVGGNRPCAGSLGAARLGLSIWCVACVPPSPPRTQAKLHTSSVIASPVELRRANGRPKEARKRQA